MNAPEFLFWRDIPLRTCGQYGSRW